jgi:hypothetical protein
MFMIKPQGLLRVEFQRKLPSDRASVGSADSIQDDFDSIDFDDVERVTDFGGLMEMEAKAGEQVEDSLSDIGSDTESQQSGVLGDHCGVGNTMVGLALAPMYFSEGDVTTDSHRGYVSSKDLGKLDQFLV